MLVWVQGLSGEGVAGSRHARTIMWLKVVMWRWWREQLGTLANARFPENEASFAVK